VNVDDMLEATSQMTAKVERALEIKQKAKDEGRKLSRREQLDGVRREALELSDRLPKFDPRSVQPGARSGAGESGVASDARFELRVSPASTPKLFEEREPLKLV
jgi:hypothetical protein